MIEEGWAANLNQAALAHDDRSRPTIAYPGLRISTAVLTRPEPVLTINVQTWDVTRDGLPSATKPLPAHTPVELFRDDDLVHRDAQSPRPGGPDANGPHNVWTKDTDEDSSLATPDDLPAHIPVELYRDDQFIHRDAPIPFGEQA
ncbi:hypothetical protein [Catenulispora subtropica]|uniref:Uncharacterized protein n=1 Tax=Catenulispora subtropica TaxID=450798 RepID=A0ABP5EPA5_9ACTN